MTIGVPEAKPARTADALPGEGPLYRRLAEALAARIADGSLPVGDRLPGVRRLKAQWRVSTSTVLSALDLLEARGLVRARPQSGYYVMRRGEALPSSSASPPEPPSTPGEAVPTSIRGISELSMRVVADAGRGDLIRLGAAEPDSDMLPTKAVGRIAARLLRDRPRHAHCYSGTPGQLELRQAVARRLLDAGCAAAADDVVVTSGCTEATALCLRACTRAGDAVAVEMPSTYGFFSTLELCRLRATPIETHPRTGMNLDHLEAAIDAGRVQAVLTVANFSNPFGTLMPEPHKQRLVRLCADREVPLIEDDVYGDLAHDGPRPRPLKAFDVGGGGGGGGGGVLYCGSSTKTVTPGFRVGWALPGRWRDEVARLKVAASCAAGAIDSLTVAEFLQSPGYDRHLRRTRCRYAENVRRMRGAVGRYFPAGTSVTNPSGGFVLWVTLPEPIDAMRLAAEARARHRIVIVPGPLFSPDRRFGNCVRLSCGLPWSDQVEAAVRTVGGLAKEQAAGVTSAGP